MWYKKFEHENGFYQDENGTRYMVTECHRVTAPDGRRNAELGYTEFSNMEECLSTWGLTKLPETALTKSTLTIKDINKLSSTEFNIKPFADVRNKLLAKFKKS